MKKKVSQDEEIVTHQNAVKALQEARDAVGRRSGRKSGIMVSVEPIALKGDCDLYNVLDDLL